MMNGHGYIEQGYVTVQEEGSSVRRVKGEEDLSERTNKCTI